MVEFKVIISDTSTGKSSVKELKDKDARVLVGMKIGDELDGSVLDSDGTIRITGGSDRAGFPMRGDVRGGVKNYVLLTDGVGFRSGQKGEKRRKLVRGNTITDEIYQVNAVLVKDGVSQKPVAKTETKKPVAKKEAKKVAEDTKAT